MPLETICKHPYLTISLEMVKFRYLLAKLNKVSVLDSQISDTISFSLQNCIVLVLHEGDNLIFVGDVAWG
jgi:hypothetical protein